MTTGLISGTPTTGNTAGAPSTVIITAEDADGGMVSDDFDLDVDNRPVVATPIADQTGSAEAAQSGTSFTFTVPAATFSDADGDTLSLTAQLSGGGSLPSWLTFTTDTFSGTPTSSDATTLSLEVTAADGRGVSTSDVFDLLVNTPPQVTDAIADQTVIVGDAVSINLSNVFTDSDSDTVALSVTGLPAWLTFDSPSSTITGTPQSSDIGSSTITVSGDDGNGGVVTEEFEVTVTNIVEVQSFVVVGSGPNAPSRVQAFDPLTGNLVHDIQPFGQFQGGIRVAAGDVTGDGVSDIIVGTGENSNPHVKVFDGVTGSRISSPFFGSFFAFDTSYRGGIYVAAGDVNNDGFADIVVSKGQGRPQVRVFSGADGSLIADFFAFDATVTTGGQASSGDVDGDGTADIIISAGGQVRVFDFNAGTPTQITSFSPGIGQVFVASSDVNNDLKADIIVGAQTGTPNVQVLDGATGALLLSFIANGSSGARIAAADVNRDGVADIVTGSGSGREFRYFSGIDGAQIDSAFAFDPGFTQGLFVGGSTLPTTNP
ncbi:MAG: FG-GAP repeat protein [Rhodopirellula sp.]|nr:FG-GAP repeat protein [Rhodopirellula sp.]